MIATEYQIDFRTLRQAYLEVKVFLEKETGDEVLSLKTRIENDLGCKGDDNYEMLEKFVIQYNLNTTGFVYTKHFLSEGELYGSGTVLLKFLLLPIVIVDLFLKLFRGAGKSIVPNIHRQTADLTFGDMLTWYLTG